jgi:adenylate cyclase
MDLDAPFPSHPVSASPCIPGGPLGPRGDSPCAMALPDAEAARTQHLPRRALVLEDDAVERELLVRRLERIGLLVLQAACVSDARAVLAHGHVDLAVMDVQLPDGCGLDLCQELIDGDRFRDLPVVILSSVRDGAIVRRARAAGGMFFLGKPYDPNVLLAIIENAIGL